ncbi:hypothetical protein AVEN_161990-1, partial [Araneus ventricosus]
VCSVLVIKFRGRGFQVRNLIHQRSTEYVGLMHVKSDLENLTFSHLSGTEGCRGVCCLGLLSVGEVRKFEEVVPAQVSSLSSDHSSK